MSPPLTSAEVLTTFAIALVVALVVAFLVTTWRTR